MSFGSFEKKCSLMPSISSSARKPQSPLRSIFVIIKVQLQIFLLFSYADHASVPPIASVIAFIAASYSPFAAKVFALLTAVESF